MTGEVVRMVPNGAGAKSRFRVFIEAISYFSVKKESCDVLDKSFGYKYTNTLNSLNIKQNNTTQI